MRAHYLIGSSRMSSPDSQSGAASTRRVAKPMGVVFVVDVSAIAAGHVAVALREHRKWASRMGWLVPSEIKLMEERFANRAMQGQQGTPLDDLWDGRQGGVVTPECLTFRDAGRMLACSERTVKRLVAAGELNPVRFPGGAVRLRVSDVHNWIDLHCQPAQTGEPNEPSGITAR